ncbi:MAG TPA: small multi-drug export protein [Methanoregulaceae archaeon]|nr:small multi-drug export protein [Methanoregulaceae archaeon]HRY74919.1 small multi-drug export protein [Methanoregulaceae archaeon]
MKLVVPFLLAVLEIIVLYRILDYPAFLITTGLMIAYILPPAGKETVIPAGILLGIPWWVIVSAIVMIDVETALFMNWNFDLALKVPYLGRIMEEFIGKARVFIREEPRLVRLYFLGIVVLVMSPVMGSGGIRGSIIGQLIGMERSAIFAAVLAGSLLGCLLIAFGTLLFREIFLRSIVAGTVVVLFVIAAVAVIWLLRIRRKKDLKK